MTIRLSELIDRVIALAVDRLYQQDTSIRYTMRVLSLDTPIENIITAWAEGQNWPTPGLEYLNGVVNTACQYAPRNVFLAISDLRAELAHMAHELKLKDHAQ